jgi:hypothetical protein
MAASRDMKAIYLANLTCLMVPRNFLAYPHCLHSACFSNEAFCSDLRCAYVAANILPVYKLPPHEITRQLQRQRHRRIITYFRSIRSSLFNSFRHGDHLNKIYKSSIPTSQRIQPLSPQRSIGTYCEINKQHKNAIRGKMRSFLISEYVVRTITTWF